MPQKEKILIVDDEQPIRNILRRYLEKAGYRCETAENTASAKELLALEPFDLILTDLMMPGESGIDLIKYAKEYYPETGRVMITAIGTQDIANEIMEIGVYGYIIKPISRDIVLITVKNAIRHLTLDLHMQACVLEMADKISKRSAKLDAIVNNINIGVIMVDKQMKVIEMNGQMKKWYSPAEATEQKDCFELLPNANGSTVCADSPMAETLKTGKRHEVEKQLKVNLEMRDFRIITTPVLGKDNQVTAAIGLFEDMTERLMIERDLHLAQKLEAVGQLAAGIAHEINTPVQFIGDNLSFLKDSFEDTYTLLDSFEEAWPQIKQSNVISESLKKKIEDSREDADLEYLAEEVPTTIQQSLDGVQRVGEIAKAMKDFSHPGEEEKSATDINKIIETTLTVCKNEWKYVAEIEKDMSVELPTVPGFPGDLSQVFLNIVVNAAHAINDLKEGGKTGMGKISIKTQLKEDCVEILIADTGGGIPENAQSRIFDPFFTTKERGKGTGQGLAIAHRIVVKKHQGNLSFETSKGDGTTFRIQLPTV